MALMSKLVLASAVAKLNPPTVEDANALAKAVAELMGDETCAVDGDGDMCTEVVVFPPYPFLGSVVEDLADVGIGVGAQSVFAEAESGAFTGAVSTAMVDERRTVFKDDDAAVNKKVLRVYEDGLKPVLCIGETKEEYEAGLCEDAARASTRRSALAELYDQPRADAVRIQYGGSVTPESVDELMSMPDIDGCLVGGASSSREVRPHLPRPRQEPAALTALRRAALSRDAVG
ncbi:triosephosphate isomerase [Aureococcus anophagefferens]|nr:triosephosphate isomerase [Aureococcus anophagefferens]